MKTRAIAVLLATLAMYVWGFLYWGVNPLPYTTWMQTTDDVAAGKALLDLSPPCSAPPPPPCPRTPLA